MPILNYTTSVPVDKTVGEITALLVRKGARSITSEFHEGGGISAVGFVMGVGGLPVHFQLPSNSAGVKAAMLKEKPFTVQHRITRAEHEKRVGLQAELVAWRILKDWIEAQLALIESGQAEMGQVFMPYATNHDGRTMYELFVENNQKQLGAGGA